MPGSGHKGAGGALSNRAPMGAGKLHKPGILRNEGPAASAIAADAQVPAPDGGGGGQVDHGSSSVQVCGVSREAAYGSSGSCDSGEFGKSGDVAPE